MACGEERERMGGKGRSRQKMVKTRKDGRRW